MADPETRPPSRTVDRALRVVATGIGLGTLLVIVRAQLMTFPWVRSTISLAPRAALAAYHDLAYVAGITLLCLALLFLARRNDRAQRLISGAYFGLALFSLFFALANVKIVPMLGRPLNYRWLYYSDFLDSQDVRNAIVAELSGRLLATAVLSGAALLAMSWVLHRAMRLFARRFGLRAFTAVGATVGFAYFLLGGVVLARLTWERSRLENPVVAFAASIATTRRPPSLLTMKTSVGFEDFEPPKPEARGTSEIVRPGRGRVRNVVFFVMESVPAEYLPLYGAPYPVTPELQRRAGESTIFTDIYAHGATTSMSLVSLLLSIYPWISYRSLTREHPDFAFPSLSSELSEGGYRTAFFNSADLRYQRVGDFLAHRDLDRVSDYRDLGCQGPILRASVKDPLLNSADDGCIVAAFSKWVRDEPERPFFAVLWTMMTHQPYFAPGPEVDFGVGDPAFNRYLNAVQYSDRLIGEILELLRALRLQDSTLLVVLGDHGETFSQHDQRGHGDIYDHSLHVPLILINPILFSGQRLPVVGGLIDVAPTVLDVLGIPAPAGWQGRSLFRPDRPPRAYFFAPFGNHLFGFREGNLKFIYDATENRVAIYDLSRDPGETKNLASSMPRTVDEGRLRIAAWVQYQDRMMNRLIGESANRSSR